MQNSQSLQWQPSQMAVKASQSRKRDHTANWFCQKSVAIARYKTQKKTSAVFSCSPMPVLHRVRWDPCWAKNPQWQKIDGAKTSRMDHVRMLWSRLEIVKRGQDWSYWSMETKSPTKSKSKGFSELHPACFPPIRLLRYDRIWQDVERIAPYSIL